MTINASVDGHIKQSRGILGYFWYEGSDALLQGEAVCFNNDYGTATAADGSRCNRVERPTTDNNKDFAGVSTRNYLACSGGQFIECYLPGSKCVPVALAVDTVLGVGLLTFCVAGKYLKGASTGLKTDAGRFFTGKFQGRGSAIPRQTVTAIVAQMTGSASMASDGKTLTVTTTAGLAAGDTVVIVGGADNGTGAVVPGKYTIASITSGTVLVLTGSVFNVAPGSALTCTYYAFTGNPTALCDLLDGSESGGVKFMNVPNAGGTTQPYMVGGVSYVCGGLTIAADASVAFAQGSRPKELKAFHLLGTLTTSDFTIIPATAGVQLARDTNGALVALAVVNAIDAAGEGWVGEFSGRRWFTVDTLSTAVEA